MEDFILANEKYVRMGFFFGMLLLIGLWELVAPKRALTVSKSVRWINNLGLVFFNSFIIRLLFPMAAVGVASLAHQQGWGLFNYVETSFWVAVLASVIIMDFVIYIQHVMVHAIPVLWRLHRVHHADLDYDVTTGARFHTIEIILSMLIKFATILLLGPPVVAVIVFEVILNATAMFNHGNISLPKSLDKYLRLFLVTPDMHRVHHSVEDDEANSNFGFSLPWWDRLFGTYRDQPRAGHEGMTIGIHKYREPKQVSWLPGMLALPFIGKMSGYVINRRQWNDNDTEK
ncbi:MAG: sterol desaturase family protein [Gammaproteobacteria bacterium]|nr:sterol desaturase family protein [Gammaproteobacteria bacterium]MDH5660396.1 sterol desaturase family protein [Gammaproteobacteria bacterium]